jgi:biopolymer transport protein ExbD
MKKLICLILSLAFVSAAAFAAEKTAVKVPETKSVSAPVSVTPAVKAVKKAKSVKKVKKTAEVKAEAKADAAVTPAVPAAK